MSFADFVDLPVTTAAADFEDMAIAYLQSVWDGYEPQDGDPEVINIESIAPIAEALGQVLASMPQQALIAFGVKLLGQPYGTGTSAYTNVLFTVQDTAGYTIPGGISSLVIDGYGFVLTNDLVIPTGSTTGTALVASTDATAAASGLPGAQVGPISMPGFVTGMTLLSPTVGGTDPQTDDDYASQISRDRRLNEKAIVTLLDFELAALDQQGITRAHADVAAGPNVTVTVLGVNGAVATTATKTALISLYNSYRMVATSVGITDPAFNVVGATYQVQGEPGFDSVALVASVSAALTNELSPLLHGVPQSGDPGAAVTTWINDPYIYLWRMVGIASAVSGVHRVVSMTLTGNQQVTLASALTTAAPITSIPLTTSVGSNLLNTIPSGAVIRLTETTTGHTDTFTTTSQTAPGAASIAVASHTPAFAFSNVFTVINAPVVGDFVMSGNVPVPNPGTFTGSAI